MKAHRITCALLGALLAATPAVAQEDEETEVIIVDEDDGPSTVVVGGEGAGAQGDLNTRVQELEREVAQLQRRVDDDDDTDEEWQLQLRGGWFYLEESHRDELIPDDDHNGWSVGIGLDMPLWVDMLERHDDDDPYDDRDDDEVLDIDLLGHLEFMYRQVGDSDEYNAPGTNSEGTYTYLNIVAGPKLRLELTDAVRPFVLTGINIMIQAPPNESFEQIDLGYIVGGGLDFKVHDKISLGAEYRYTWFGASSLTDEDYGEVVGYLGFNF